MISSKICIVAEGVIRDVQTNGISIFSIFEELTAQGFPTFIQRMAFYAHWEKEQDDPEQYNTIFTITLDGEQLMSKSVNINFEGRLRNRSIVTINGLMLSKPGNLLFSMKVEDGPEARYEVLVRAVDSSIQTIPDEDAST